MRPLPEGTITFLLTDIEGSVRLWEQGAGAMQEASARHDALIESVVGERGGVVVRPRGEGDSRFAVFARASNAALAALEIQRQFQREPWPTSTPVRVRIALHTGEAELRAGDYYGSDVNRCARLRSIAQGGQVLLSERTARLVQGDLPPGATLENLGHHRLRDLKLPERVFQLRHPELPTNVLPLLSGESGTGPAEPASFLPAYPFPTPDPLIGRDRELHVLDQVLTRGRAQGQAVFVGASAGEGKSALLGAVVRRAHESGMTCLAGGCYESEAVIPLRPFRDGLVDYLLALPAEVVRADLGSAAFEFARVAPELRYHLDLPRRAAATADIDQGRLFGTFHAALRRLTRKAPVLLCIEDLHAADAATLDLIQFLVRQARRLPVVLVGTYRRDELRRGHLAQLLAVLAREGALQMELSPLSREDTARLAASLLGDPASERLNETLYATTDGNPFFIEQLVLALREDQRIAWRGGVWHQVAEAAGVVPPMVREVIQSRLDRLSERCRETLAMAAVLGQSVEHGTLLAACEGARDTDLLESLEEGLQAQILQETGNGYAFGHALLREALYWSLSTPRRMLLHARAGHALEELAAARHVDRSAELAHHFVLAGPAPPIRAKVLQYSLQAGQAAAALSSHREALAHFVRACELIDGGEVPTETATRLEALRGRAQAERDLGLWQACIVSFERLLEQTADPVQRAQAHGAIGRALAQRGTRAGALAAYENGLAELQAVNTPEALSARLQLLYHQAFCYLREGRFKQVLRLGERMLESAAPLGRPSLVYRAHSVVALAWMHQGQVEPAFEHYQAALAAAEQTGDKVELAVVHENLGANHYRGGEFAAARAELSQAIDLYRDSVGEVRAILALQILSRVSLAQGYLDEAITTIEQAEAIALEAGDRWRAECHQARGAVLAVRGEWQSAKDCLERAVATHEQVGHPVGLIESLVELGSVYEQIGEWSEACAGARRALELSRSLDPCPVTVSVKAHLGRVLLKQGALADATAQIEQALALARTMPRSLEYAPALLAMAELAHGVDPTRAIRYGKQALERAKTAELMWQAHMFLAMAYCAAGDGAASVRHVACAARLAEQTRSWWLSDQVSRMRVTIADLMGWTGGEDAALAEAQAWHGETGPLSLATS